MSKLVEIRLLVLICFFSLSYSYCSIKPSYKYHLSVIDQSCIAGRSVIPTSCNFKKSSFSSKLTRLRANSDTTLNPRKESKTNSFFEAITTIWDFSRPHTLIGSGLSVLSLYLFATPTKVWFSQKFIQSYLVAVVPALFMNIYITGLNQLTDIEIDKINKPYLPIASGKLSKLSGSAIVFLSLLISLSFLELSNLPLKCALIGSGILGTIYSLPPFRLKRFPLLAAFCILVVRGSLINLGFYYGAKIDVLSNVLPNTFFQTLKAYPQSGFLAIFFAVFGLVIAILKDAPDVIGDKSYNIPSFSVIFGSEKTFQVSWKLLMTLLISTGIGILYPLSSRFSLPQLLVGTILAISGFDVRRRAKRVNIKENKAIYSFYMYIWNLFYLTYILLPFLR